MSAPPGTPADDAAAVALQRVLRATHAAVAAVGLVGADLSDAVPAERPAGVPAADPAAALADAAGEAHRARRERLEALLRERGAEPVAAAPAYRAEPPVTDRAGALALAPRVEDDVVAAALRGVAGAAAVRPELLDAAREAAGLSVRWRLLAGPPADATRAFPPA